MRWNDLTLKLEALSESWQHTRKFLIDIVAFAYSFAPGLCDLQRTRKRRKEGKWHYCRARRCVAHYRSARSTSNIKA